MVRRIVVVGASLAGLRAVETLRAQGFDGALVLVGDEPHAPYDRPPLSKQVLQGTLDPRDTAYRRKEGYEALALDMRLGSRAVGLEPGRRVVILADGSRLDYDRLVVTTGARARMLPGAGAQPGLHLLRGLDDAVRLSSELAGAATVAIVGAGFIGLEVAASCRARGLRVTVIEALPAPLSPVFGPAVCGMVAALHRDHGVDLRTGVTVAGLRGGTRVEGVRLSDGSDLAADLTIVGIGVTPNTEWLEDSGLTLKDGIVCDAAGAAAPDVFAAGDVARIPNAWTGDDRRVEHWTNAVEQAVLVAGNALAGERASTPFVSVPYFWSDQYDRKIQCAGRVQPGDEAVLVEGSFMERSVAVLYRRGDRVAACLTVNRPRTFVAFRRLLKDRRDWGDVVRAGGAAASRDTP
jgi:NADPH-dependent 2,4-dienoyl-CoA reductase/sulfur reductase-like enzyme